MTSSKLCLKNRNRIKIPNSKILEKDQDHDMFLSKLNKAFCCENFNTFPLNTSLGRLPLSELAKELKTGNLISKFEEFEYYTDGEDESPFVYTCSFVLAIMYFERLKVSNPTYLRSINSSELFLISLLVASKYLHDDGELDSAINSEWATAYGISLKDINQMEKEYLSAMNWEFYISEEEYSKKYNEIIFELYSDIKKSNSILIKMFLLISKVTQTIRKLYRKKVLRQKIKQMIAMSTVITVVTATAAMQLKTDPLSWSTHLARDLQREIKTDPNYPIIPSTHLNPTPTIKRVDNTASDLIPSKLTLLLNHLMLMNICLSYKHQLSPYKTVLEESFNSGYRNIANLNDTVFLNKLIPANFSY
ncbi:uncharacterized protein LOC126838481 [Adelges cooleyi]|uniref:uncharacterized protein LOC126838481 n=1 Tax=Adelges cooleyi TaxID=133065 RepID=UPI00217F4894|nr:uncharacterized protein LOC126838481 [Adelges cooleyi]